MQATKLKGIKVLDKYRVEIGKVSDLGVNLAEFKIENILISTGGFFSKKYFTVDINEIEEINSELHLKSSKEEQNIAISLEELKLSSPYDYFFKNFQKRLVRTNDEPILGLIKDIIFDLKDNLTFDVIIEKFHGGPLTLGKPSFTASLEDFSSFDIVMTLKLDRNGVKEIKK